MKSHLHFGKPGRVLSASLLAGMAWLAGAASATADERLFTYSYEADVLPKGGLEFEQWITNRSGKEDGVFSRWDIREEIEYGLTDRLTTALYLNFRSIYSDGVPGREDGTELEFRGVSSEWKLQVLSPHQSPIGVLLYGEVTYSGDELELEEKLILQHNFGDQWVAVLNATFEQEWEFESGHTETAAIVEVTAGIAYKVTPQFSIGLEARTHTEFPDWGEAEDTGVFVGPTLHYATGKWWATLTVMPQVTDDLEGHERIETRLIAGFNF